MTLPLMLLVLFGLLGLGTIWWGRGRIRRIEYGRMPVLIGEAMSRLGLTPADAESAGLDRAVVKAGESCRSCEVGSQCRDWLAASYRAGPGRHCPNAALFDEIRARRRPEPPRAVTPRNLGIY